MLRVLDSFTPELDCRLLAAVCLVFLLAGAVLIVRFRRSQAGRLSDKGHDGGAGGDAEMQIKLAEKIFPVAMAVEKARQHGLAAGVDDLRALRNGHLAVAAGGGEAAVLDNDDGILDRRPSGAVD